MKDISEKCYARIASGEDMEKVLFEEGVLKEGDAPLTEQERDGILKIVEILTKINEKADELAKEKSSFTKEDLKNKEKMQEFNSRVMVLKKQLDELSSFQNKQNRGLQN